MEYYTRVNLKKLKDLRKNVVDWDNEAERREFLHQFHSLVQIWKGRLPNLHDVFSKRDIDWFLTESLIRFTDGQTAAERRYGRGFIEFVAESGYRDSIDMWPLRRTTAIHRLGWDRPRLEYGLGNTVTLMRKLFEIYQRPEGNYVDELGLSHFHVACKYGFKDMVVGYLNAGNFYARSSERNPNRAVRATGDAPLHLALAYNRDLAVAELLLRRTGADPNSLNERRETPLHILCGRHDDYAYDLVEPFLAMCEESGRPVRLDEKDESGRTPLHLALYQGKAGPVESLLRRGADPNDCLASEDRSGTTLLHVVSDRLVRYEYDLLRIVVAIDQKIDLLAQLDVRNDTGWTPLHLAVARGHKSLVEWLLRNGADPNLANAEGSSPLHSICSKNEDCELMEMLFEISDEKHRPVQVDAKDKSGRTPLQLAVASLLPNAIGVLLARGADPSSFVFPTESDFAEGYRPNPGNLNLDLRLASRIVDCVERLERGGYELDRSDVAIVVKSFVELGLIWTSATTADLKERWYEDEVFTKVTRWTMVKPNLSLCDLVRMRPDEATKLFTQSDLTRAEEMCKDLFDNLYKSSYYWRACALNLGEKVSRRFFRSWALELFTEMTQCRLPILCWEMIVEDLTNEDLSNICLAAAVPGQNHEDDKRYDNECNKMREQQKTAAKRG